MGNQDSGDKFEKLTKIIIIGTMLLLCIVIYKMTTADTAQKIDSYIDDSTVITTSPECLDGVETVQRADGEDLTDKAHERFSELVNVSNYSSSECRKRMLAEGYYQEEYQDALDNTEVSWNNVAYERAQTYYSEYSGANRSQIMAYLEGVGFSNFDATYAVNMLRVHDSNTSYSSPKSSSTEKAATIGELNALKKATEYLNVMHFSKKGLKKQLLFEKFSESEAEYAVTKLDIDWKLQAVGKALDYLDSMSFSKQKLKEQLEFEGFTSDEAKYAVDAVYK